MASAMNKISLRVEQLLQPLHLAHQLFVDVQAAGGVDDERVAAHVAGLAAGLAGQPLDQRRTGWFALLVAFVERGFDGFGDDLELLARGGAIHVHRDQHGPMAALLEPCGQLAAVVVLPEPCRPAIKITVGGCEANLKRAVSLPSSAISSSRTILITCSEGERAVSTSVPTALTRICSIRSRDDVEVDVGLEQRHANLAQGFGNVFFGERALAAKGLEGALQFVCKVLKHRSVQVYRGESCGRSIEIHGFPGLRIETRGQPALARY